MKPSQPWQIASNDRLFIPGKTGVGKTAAVKHLVLDPLDRVLFLDIKGREHRSIRHPVVHDLDDVHTALFAEDPDRRLDKFVFAPERPDIDLFDEVCRLVYEKGNHHLIADELKSVYHGAQLTEHHNLIMTNGRDKGVGFTGTTQRPKRIPIEAISEAEHVLAFKLKTKTDRDRMEEVIGEKAAELRSIDPYWYIYDHDRLDAPEVCTPLDL